MDLKVIPIKGARGAILDIGVFCLSTNQMQHSSKPDFPQIITPTYHNADQQQSPVGIETVFSHCGLFCLCLFAVTANKGAN